MKSINHNQHKVYNNVITFVLGLSGISCLVALILSVYYTDTNEQRALGYLALFILFLITTGVIGHIPIETEEDNDTDTLTITNSNDTDSVKVSGGTRVKCNNGFNPYEHYRPNGKK